jgi:tmRNA-binding protein
MDVLLLIYHFARYGAGNVLEIGPYVGGSTIAATAKRVRKLLLHREEIDRLYGETQVKGRALVVLPDRIQ